MNRNRRRLLFALWAVIPAYTHAAIQFEETTSTANITYAGESYGASVGDQNGDGLPDIFASNHRNRPSIYINRGDGTFNDIGGTVPWLRSGHADTHGGSWADFDNDGDQDFYLTAGRADSNQFFVNDNGTLVDRTSTYDPAVSQWRARMPIWLDFNRDGRLDFLIAAENASRIYAQTLSGFVDRTIAAGVSCDTKQSGFLSDLNVDGSLELICADGTFPGRIYSTTTLPFTNLTSLVPPTSLVLETVLADLDNNLRPDAFMVRGKRRLTEAAQSGSSAVEAHIITSGSREKGFNFENSGTINVSIDWDGQPLSLFSNLPSIIYIGSSGRHPSSRNFSLSASDSSTWGIKPHSPGSNLGIYIGYDTAAGRWRVLLSPGGHWSQAHIDIAANSPVSSVVTTGRTADELPMQPALLMNFSGGFQNRTSAAGLGQAVQCNGAVAGDFDNDMDQDLYLVCRGGIRNLPNRLFENRGDGTFVEVTQAGGAAGIVGSGVDAGTGENVVVADYDVDGFLDLFVTNGLNMIPVGRGGPSQLFRNTGNGNRWIELDLVGTASNRDGVGAKVFATAGGVTQLREQNGGFHRWSQNHQRLHFGLGGNNTVNLRVEWPSGAVDQYNSVAAGRLYRVTEDAGIEPVSIGQITPSLSIDDRSVSEGTADVTFTVRLSGPSSQTVTVNYATEDVTAVGGADFTAVSGSLTFAPGATVRTITVPILNDTLPEGTETFRVVLSNVINATIADGVGVGTIIDDESSPCGGPTIQPDSDAALFLWQDCSSGAWSLRATAGGGYARYAGSLQAGQPFTTITPFSVESHDTFDIGTAGRIDLVFQVWGTSQDGVDFTVPIGVDVCVDLDAPVRVGPDSVAVNGPFSLTTLAACDGSTTPPNPDGAPSYNPAVDAAAFLWRQPNGSWRMRFTGGGAYANYVGTVLSDEPLSSVPFSIESHDTFDASNPTRINFDLQVWGSSEDGFDVAFPASAQACLDIAQPAGGTVLVGPDRVALTPPFTLDDDLAACAVP